MKQLVRLIVFITCLALLFATVTLMALEGGEVVVLRTSRPDGTPRETRIWIVEDGGELLIEAADEERTFLTDVRARPLAELVRGSEVIPVRATPLANPGGHRRIRRLLRQRYGWADWWIGLIADTSASVALRLQPANGISH